MIYDLDLGLDVGIDYQEDSAGTEHGSNCSDILLWQFVEEGSNQNILSK